VCQGGSGGGCPGGGAASGRRNAAEIQQIYQYNEAVDTYNKGLAAFRAGRNSEAEEDFRQALSIYPDVPNGRSALLLSQGWGAYSSGDFAGALNYYQQMLQIDPKDGQALYRIDQTRAAIAATTGNDAWRRGDLSSALADFKSAYDLYQFKSYLDSINTLQGQLRQEQQQAAARQQTSRAVSDLVATVAAAQDNRPVTTAGLDFKAAEDPSSIKGSSSPGLFGDPVAKPDLGPPLAAAAPAEGGDTRASAQLKAAARDGAAGGDLTPNYDIGGVRSAGELAIAPERLAQTPGAAELVAHIGAGMQNQGIRNSVSYYQKLDGLKLDAQAQLAAVQQQLDHGGGDAAALKAHKETLVTQIADYKVQQATTEAQIKQQMTAINIPWTETPATAPAATAKR
jgi:tetratricopeptide (TPR) repeat protein